MNEISGDAQTLYDAEGIAEVLKVSASTVRRMWADGRLPAPRARIGRRRMINRETLIDFIRKTQPKAETIERAVKRAI